MRLMFTKRLLNASVSCKVIKQSLTTGQFWIVDDSPVNLGKGGLIVLTLQSEMDYLLTELLQTSIICIAFVCLLLLVLPPLIRFSLTNICQIATNYVY